MASPVREVNFRLIVRESESDQDAIELAVNYFCGGDNYQIVDQAEPSVRILSDGELEAAKV